MNPATVGFIGAGKMGGAIIRGILQKGILEPSQIAVTARTDQTLDTFGRQGVQVTRDAFELVQACRYVFLAVKPQMLDQVLSPIRTVFRPETVVVSIVAGRGVDYYKKQLGDGCRLILAMPNTPLMLGYGATTISRVEPTTQEEFSFIRDLFGQIGVVEEIDPALSNEAIPVHGSSPAFIYLFAREMIRSAQDMGLDPAQCNRLFAQTLIGAAHMMTDTGYSHQELIDMVCSPGGTTLAALHSLEQDRFGAVIERAYRACVNRAYELSGNKPEV